MKRHPWIYSALLVLGFWTIAHLLSSRGLIPSPIETLSYILRHPDTLALHIGASLFRILLAILATAVLGTAVGILTARHAGADAALSPLLYTLYPVPKIAFLPLIMLFLGLGNRSKIFLVFLILFFQVAITIRDAVKAIPQPYFLSIRSMGASPLQINRHVVLPAMLPGLITSLRLSVGTSLSVLFFAENFATTRGIGFFVMDSWLKLDYTAMFAGILLISGLGSILFALLDRAERRLCRWKTQ